MAFCRSSPAARPTKLPACEACAAATATGATKSYALCRTQPRIKMRKCPTVCSRSSSSSSSLSISSLSSASVSSCFCCLRLSTASSSRRSQRTRYTRTMRRSTESRRRRWRSKALQDYLPTEVPTYLPVTAPLSVRTEDWLCSRIRKILFIIDHFRCFFAAKKLEVS